MKRSFSGRNKCAIQELSKNKGSGSQISLPFSFLENEIGGLRKEEGNDVIILSGFQLVQLFLPRSSSYNCTVDWVSAPLSKTFYLGGASKRTLTLAGFVPFSVCSPSEPRPLMSKAGTDSLLPLSTEANHGADRGRQSSGVDGTESAGPRTRSNPGSRSLDDVCHPQMASFESLNYEIAESVVYKADQASR